MAPSARLLRSLPGVAGRLVAATVLLGGVPYALARLVGWPLPRSLSWHGSQRFLVSPLADDAIHQGPGLRGVAAVGGLHLVGSH
jgi:hypothetical protein